MLVLVDDDQKAAIWAAARDIEAHTCVQFRYRRASDKIYTRITVSTQD